MCIILRIFKDHMHDNIPLHTGKYNLHQDSVSIMLLIKITPHIEMYR